MEDLFQADDIEKYREKIKPLSESEPTSEEEEFFPPRNTASRIKPQANETEQQVLDSFFARKLISRENDYVRQKRRRALSPDRDDTEGYKDTMEAKLLDEEHRDILQEISKEKERSKVVKKRKVEESTATTKSKWSSTITEPETQAEEKSLWDLGPSQSEEQQDSNSVYTSVTPQQLLMMRLAKEIEEKNKPITDLELNELLPQEGYEIIQPPADYKPAKQRAQSSWASQVFTTEAMAQSYEVPGGDEDFPEIKPEDIGYFGALLQEVDFNALPFTEQCERRVMELLLKIKNGTPLVRKQALRQITEHARELGAGTLFSQIIPLMMSPTLEDQERHLLVKVIDRILYKLDDLIAPYVHKILVVASPMLIDEDYYSRVEGREIISNLAKAAGLPNMLQAMRPDIDHHDEIVRNTTARALAVTATALGIPSLIPFLKALIGSKRSWMARYTGIKVCQQVAILQGCGILPHLKSLVICVESGLSDEVSRVKTITGLALASLAEASAPYGIEAFASVLPSLRDGIRSYRGRTLSAFLKAIGFIIPLMDPAKASGYTRDIVGTIVREFKTQDDEMREIILKVIQQCVTTDGIESQFVRDEILPQFFSNFWQRRIAMEKRTYNALISTTVALAQKIGVGEMLMNIVPELKDDNEVYRKMVMETVMKIAVNLGVADVNLRLEEEVIDGIMYVVQQQTTEGTGLIIKAFGTIISAFGLRSKSYLNTICATIQWRLTNKIPRIRSESADLIGRIAPTMKLCGEEVIMGRLGVILYESLGEEYPEVLGSFLSALRAIVGVIGMTKMTPPVKDLLPKLTPILKNRNEKVQENCIDLIGRIAERGSEYVSAKEWMRICIDLIELLSANKKAIRRNATTTFGYIARTIGPQDVLATLLANLRLPDRQTRVCTTVAIAIISEICGPFTTIPILMNEYRMPEVNVQNGVLKSFAFMFEYIGEMTKDYVYAVLPLLEDALIDKDLVHRQVACAAVKHLALGIAGLGCEPALLHLLNLVWPNIFESSPHVIN